MVIVKEVHSQAKQLSQSKPVVAADAIEWNLDLNSQILEQMPPMLLLRPTKMSANWVPAGMFGNHRYFARGQTVKELITTIYSQKNSEAKLVFLAPLPDDKFDCVVTGQPIGWMRWNLKSTKGSILLSSGDHKHEKLWSS
jgi:hypothetical protein